MAEREERPLGWAPSAEQFAGGLLAGHDKALKMVAKEMLGEAPKAARFVAKRIPGVPGLVYDGATYAAAKDRRRAGVELAGGAIGAVIGGVGGPVGSMVGSMAGEKLAELAYDHRQDIKAWMNYDDHADGIRRRIEATKAWMGERNADIARRMAHR